jgi:hypothetical protein
MDYFKAGRTIVEYAWKGGLIVAGGALAAFMLAIPFGWLRQPPTERLLSVLVNYFVVGALAGGLVAAAILARDWWGSRE